MSVTTIRRPDPRRAAPAGSGVAVIPEWEDAELLRLVAAARDRARGR